MGTEYKSELRENRAAFVDGLTRKYGDLPRSAMVAYDRKAMAIQNETRGKLGELLGEVNLTSTGAANEEDILRDQVRFKTPLGVRRIDVWNTATRHATEVKSGYTCLSRFVRKQIEKDVFLRDEGFVNTMSWLLLQGGSGPLLQSLENNNIEVLAGWPDFAALPKYLTAGIEGSRSVVNGEWT